MEKVIVRIKNVPIPVIALGYKTKNDMNIYLLPFYQKIFKNVSNVFAF